MFSKSLTMVVVALVGLAGFVTAQPTPPGNTCPADTYDYCCGNPDTNDFSVDCHPYTDLQTCVESGGFHFCCGPDEQDDGFKCTFPPASAPTPPTPP